MMNRRKQIGIIKYGKRHYKVQKLQGGGTVYAQTGGYNWREDPYEMMLLRQKLQREEIASRERRAARMSKYRPNSGKPKTVKQNKAGVFAGLKGGLDGSRNYFNKEYSKLQDTYYNAIKANGNEWITSDEAIRMHQQIVNVGIEYNQRLASEKENFEKASKTMKDSDDENALAISSGGNIFVFDNEANENKEIDMAEYTGNLKRYQAYTKRILADKIKNTYTDKNSYLISSYLGSGALGKNSVDKQYIDINRDKVNYKKIEGDRIARVSIGNKSEGSVSAKDLQDSLEIYMKTGGDVNVGSPNGVAKDIKGVSIADIVSNVYQAVVNNTEDQSTLIASLRSEVLRDGINRVLLEQISDPAERQEMLQRMVKKTLVEKFFAKPSKGSNATVSADGEGGSHTNAPNVDRISGALMGVITGYGPEPGKYVVQNDGKVYVGTDDKEYRNVENAEYVFIPEIFSMNDLGITKDLKDLDGKDLVDAKTNSTINRNKVISDAKYGTKLYFANGADAADVMGSQEIVNDFFEHGAVISPSENVGMVMLPTDAQGNPLMDMGHKFLETKKKFTEKMIEAHNKLVPDSEKITTPVNEFFSGDARNESYKKDKDNYNKFVALASADVDELEDGLKKLKESDASDQDILIAQKHLKLVKAASNVVKNMSKALDVFRGNGNIRIRPFLKVRNVIDNDYGDGFRLETKLEEFGNSYKDSDNPIYSTTGNLLRDASPVEDDFIDDAGKDSWGWWPRADAKVIDMLVPIKPDMVRSTQEGKTNIIKVIKGAEAEQKAIDAMEKKSIMTNKDSELAIDFLKL